MITLTPEAAEHIKGYIAKAENGRGFRITLKPAGCSGFAYELDIIKKGEVADHVFYSEDVMVVTDKDSFMYLDGTEIDYEVDGLQSGLKFNNPSVKGACGCGESVYVE